MEEQMQMEKPETQATPETTVTPETTSTPQASQYDVIIVGGGPGGSAAALYSARKKLNVLLLEKAHFPRDKTCGDALSGKSVKILRELNIIEKYDSAPHAQINGLILSGPDGTQIDIPFPIVGEHTRPAGYSMRREYSDNAIFQSAKAEAGVTTKEGYQVLDVIQEEGFVKGVKTLNLETKQQEEFRAPVVIGADGSNSIVATKLGLNTIDEKHQVIAIRAYYEGITNLTDRIEIHFIEDILPGYFWIFPIEDGKANVGVGMLTKDMKEKKVDIKANMLKAIENNPLFKDRFVNAKLEGDIKGWTLPLGSTHRKAYGNGFMLIGDAASLIDPFSGEGVGNAMVAGKYAAERIAEAKVVNDYSEVFLKAFDDRLWAEIGGELKTSHMLQKMGKRRFLLNLVFNKAANKPKVREVISGMLANEEARREFVNPLSLFKLMFL